MSVHPGAWWIWALVLAGAATVTTNLLILALFITAICLVVATCAQDTTPFRLYLVVAAAVVVVRVAFRVVFPAGGGTALMTLPAVHLGPLELFGTVTVEALLSGLAGGLQLAVVILAVGAAHTLADVLELLKHAPPALAGVSTALVIAVSVFPSLGRSVVDVRRASQLRGANRRLRGLRATVIPVLEGTMDRSLALAAAMEARGYGSRGGVGVALGDMRAAEGASAAGGEPAPGAGSDWPPTAERPRSWAQPACVLGAVTCVALAAYGLFDSAWPGWAPVALTIAAVLALVAASRLDRSARRTVYRPHRWTAASTAVVVSATLSAGLLFAGVPAEIRQPPAVLLPDATTLNPLTLLPDLTLLALLAPLVAAAPALFPSLVRWRRS